MKLILLLLVMGTTAWAQTNEIITVRVTGDRVSLRSAPVDGKVLDQASRGEELVLLSQTNGWASVQAPEYLNFWVASEYLVEGIVQPKRLNVRSGPSLYYNKVAVVDRDDVLTVRDEFNKWFKIAPPEGSFVWISTNYIEMVEVPEPVVVVAPPVVVEVEPVVVQVEPVVVQPKPVYGRKASPPAQRFVLDKTMKQEVERVYPGVLRRANPGIYKLVMVWSGLEETICLVKGDINQMEKYLNQSVRLKGPIYWVKGIDVPVMTPTVIEPAPLLSE